MADAYTHIVLDHFNYPRNVGALENPDAIGQAENPVSGATIVLHLRVLKNQIDRATFQSQGCTATIAASSMLTELLPGRTLEEAEQLSRVDIEQALGGLPPTRKHAADLAADVARAAVQDYRSRRQT
jgi:NifU-like protein involved in Fe-S cluster formation